MTKRIQMQYSYRVHAPGPRSIAADLDATGLKQAASEDLSIVPYGHAPGPWDDARPWIAITLAEAQREYGRRIVAFERHRAATIEHGRRARARAARAA